MKVLIIMRECRRVWRQGTSCIFRAVKEYFLSNEICQACSAVRPAPVHSLLTRSWPAVFLTVHPALLATCRHLERIPDKNISDVWESVYSRTPVLRSAHPDMYIAHMSQSRNVLKFPPAIHIHMRSACDSGNDRWDGMVDAD